MTQIQVALKNPKNFSPKLFSWQDKHARALAGAKLPLYLADDTGLGKTLTAIEALKRMGARRVLIVCPVTAVLVWKQQIARWWPDAPPVKTEALNVAGPGIFISSYGLFSPSQPSAMMLALRAAAPMDATVLDEAHYLKNSAANRTRALLFKLKDKLGRMIPMSATPSPNHAGELWSVLFALRPDLILTADGKRAMREWEYKSLYVEVDQFTVHGHQVERIKGSKNVDALRRRLDGFFIRVTKKQALPELPPMQFDTLPVGVSAEILGGFKDVIPSSVTGEDEIIAYLRDGGSAIQRVLATLGMAKVPQVAEWCIDFLENNPKEQLVVWAMHHAVVDYLVQQLRQFGVSKIDGRDSPALRQFAEENFVARKTRAFVGHVQAGGVALTLLADPPCETVVFAEASFSPADNYQAASRVHRIGQTGHVQVWFACAEGTFDRRVQEILARKARDTAELFG